MLGRKVNQPVDLVFPPSQESIPDSSDDYVVRLKQSIRVSHEIAREIFKSTQDVMKRERDLRFNEHPYNVGDFVYVLDPAVIKSTNRKLVSPCKGPGIIVRKFTPYLYKVKLKTTVFTTNHDRLKLCNNRKIPT